MARDLGKLEDDMGSIEALRGKRGSAKAPRMAAPVAAKRPMANPADANIFTADKGIQPPADDDMGSIQNMAPKTPRQMKAAGDIRTAMGMKKGGCVKKMASGGSTGSASKRADGIATKGKTKGRIL